MLSVLHSSKQHDNIQESIPGLLTSAVFQQNPARHALTVIQKEYARYTEDDRTYCIDRATQKRYRVKQWVKEIYPFYRGHLCGSDLKHYILKGYSRKRRRDMHVWLEVNSHRNGVTVILFERMCSACGGHQPSIQLNQYHFDQRIYKDCIDDIVKLCIEIRKDY